jgi:hypothetical protein
MSGVEGGVSCGSGGFPGGVSTGNGGSPWRGVRPLFLCKNGNFSKLSMLAYCCMKICISDSGKLKGPFLKALLPFSSKNVWRGSFCVKIHVSFNFNCIYQMK